MKIGQGHIDDASSRIRCLRNGDGTPPQSIVSHRGVRSLRTGPPMRKTLRFGLRPRSRSVRRLHAAVLAHELGISTYAISFREAEICRRLQRQIRNELTECLRKCLSAGPADEWTRWRRWPRSPTAPGEAARSDDVSDRQGPRVVRPRSQPAASFSGRLALVIREDGNAGVPGPVENQRRHKGVMPPRLCDCACSRLAQRCRFSGGQKPEQALATYDTLLAAADYADGLRWRAKLAVDLEDGNRPSPICRAIKLLPLSEGPLTERARVYEYAAVTPSRRRLRGGDQVDTRYSGSHHELAWLRTACPDPKFGTENSAESTSL